MVCGGIAITFLLPLDSSHFERWWERVQRKGGRGTWKEVARSHIRFTISITQDSVAMMHNTTNGMKNLAHTLFYYLGHVQSSLITYTQ
jgi:hypothetical protein